MTKTIITLAILLFFSKFLFSQNLISNPGFELGTIPTNENQVPFATDWTRDCGKFKLTSPGNPIVPGSPDLFDGRSTNTCYDFTNKWGTLTERNGMNRYVGFAGGNYSVNDGNYYYSETVEGKIIQALLANCTYKISFYAASAQGFGLNGCGTIPSAKTPQQYDIIEVVLRKNNNCNTSKIIYSSPVLNSVNWTQYSGQFSLNTAEAAMGFNRIEFRFTKLPTTTTLAQRTRVAFLDDVSLTTAQEINFTINGTAAVDPNTGNVPSIICQAGIINMNLLSIGCQPTYWVGVWETTGNWWDRTYDYEWGGWFPIPFPSNINLQSLSTSSSSRWINGPNTRKDNILMGGIITHVTSPGLPSFIGGDRYYTIEVCTSVPSWTCKKIQIKVVW